MLPPDESKREGRMRLKRFEAEFNPVYEKYYPGIYRYVFRIIGNQEESNQIAQQTFMNFYKYLCNQSSINSSKAMVYKIANNICYDYLRKKKRSLKVPINDLVAKNMEATPEDDLLRYEKNNTFRDGLKKLSSKDQQCILLYHEGFSYAEISACLRIKENSVGKVLSRAIEKLVRIIKNGEKKCDV
ncbi:RNA polymerase sigma factor [Acidobacteriota bacterium]